MEPENLTEAAHDAVTSHEVVQEAVYQDPKFWVAVAFVIFVLLAAKYIWPRIAGLLDLRAAAIRSQLEQAARLRAEAEELLASYKAQQAQMLKDAEDILAHATRDAATIREKAAEELKLGLERRTQQAQENIARAEGEAVAQLRTNLVDVATEATRLVVSEQLKGQKEDPTVARALAAIERQIH